MKERIVIEADKKVCVISPTGITISPTDFDGHTKEQVPETFEELKDLCEDLEGKDVFITSAGDCIEYHGLQFWVSGIVCHETEKFYSIKSDRTPQQMWNIIKSLIGEE